MRIAVVSDLHLGIGDDADRFPHDDEEFSNWLLGLLKTHDRLFALGDVWETLMPYHRHQLAPEFHRETLQAAMKAHPKTTEVLLSPRCVLFSGNHDLCTSKELGALEQLHLVMGKWSVLFLHGDRFDHPPINPIKHNPLFRPLEEQIVHLTGRAPSTKPSASGLGAWRDWVTETGIWTGGWLLRMGFHSTFAKFERAVSGRILGANPERFLGYRKRALELAKARSANMVVTGHTHRAVIGSPHDGVIYCNSGTCLNETPEALSLDFGRSSWELIRG